MFVLVCPCFYFCLSFQLVLSFFSSCLFVCLILFYPFCLSVFRSCHFCLLFFCLSLSLYIHIYLSVLLYLSSSLSKQVSVCLCGGDSVRNTDLYTHESASPTLLYSPALKKTTLNLPKPRLPFSFIRGG